MNRLIIFAGALLIMIAIVTVMLGTEYASAQDARPGSSVQPTPTIPMDPGRVTLTQSDDGTTVITHTVGNATVNVEVYPPVEEKEVVEIVVFEITDATAVCNSVTKAVGLKHSPENFGRNQILTADAHIWRSDSDFIDFGEVKDTGRQGTEYLILNMSLNENMTEFTGHGVVADSIRGLCSARDAPVEDMIFPIIVTGTCGAGTSYLNGTTITHTPGTFRMEGQSANSFTVTSTAPDFYSYCYRK